MHFYFSSRSNMVSWAFEWRKGKTLCLSKTVLSCDMKVICTWTSVNAKGQGHSMNKLANQQTSKLFITCNVLSKDIPSEATWEIGSQFVCTIHVLAFYVLVSWKSLFNFGCYGNINTSNWGELKSLVTNCLVRFQNNLAEMIPLSDSTKIAQAAIFIENLGTMNWGQFVLLIHIENLKNVLVKNQRSDFEIIWQQPTLSRPLLNKDCWFIENVSHLSSGELSGPWASCYFSLVY